jgi:hypothetical protein
MKYFSKEEKHRDQIQRDPMNSQSISVLNISFKHFERVLERLSHGRSNVHLQIFHSKPPKTPNSSPKNPDFLSLSLSLSPRRAVGQFLSFSLSFSYSVEGPSILFLKAKTEREEADTWKLEGCRGAARKRN